MSDHPAPQPLVLDDLNRWSFSGTALAVLGHPIRHSVSPAMHNAALAVMARSDARFAGWRYFKFDIPPENLPAALTRLHASGFLGLNLTIPHKVLALACVERVAEAARPVGAVNTLRRTPTGWEGFNTDGHGLAEGVRAALGIPLSGTAVILLGAGGAARGAAVECLRQGCSSLWIANRTRERLVELLDHLRPVAGAIPVHGFDPGHPPPDLPAGALVVNATSAGMKPGDPLPVAWPRLPRPSGVFDMIYNPAETPLLAAAIADGVPAANGLPMLVHQGARSLEIWSGAPVPVDAMMEAARAAMKAC